MRVSLLILLPLLVAADWPMGGRTNDRNPVSLEKNALTDWAFPMEGETPRNIKWVVKTGGSRNLGGPVISGGLVWIGTNDYDYDGKRDNSVLACYRETDGKFLYKHVTPRRGEFFNDWPSQGLSGSPLVEGDRLWFCTNRREIVCLDIGPLKNGTGQPKEVWKLDMVTQLKVCPRALTIPGHDTYGSLASYKDFVYALTGNGFDENNEKVAAPDAPSLVCLHKDTGKIVWQDSSPGKEMMFGHYASPLVVEVNGRAQVIHPQADGWVRSFAAETGKLIWKFDVNPKAAKGDAARGRAWGDRVYVVATPIFANGRVYFATGLEPEACGGVGRLFCVDPTKTGDVSPELDDGRGKGMPNPNSAVVWAFENDGPARADRMHQSLGSVAVAGGFVVTTAEGFVQCFEEKTGRRLWTQDTKARIFGNALIADGKIYVTTEVGEVWALELAPKKKVIAKIEDDSSFVAPPVFANGTLYLLSEKTLYAVRKL